MVTGIRKLLLLFTLIIGGIQAEGSDSIRTRKIRNVERGIYIAPQVKYRYPSINFTGQDPTHRRLTYRPNNKYIGGFRLMAFGATVEVSASLTPGDRSVSRYGKTNVSDFTINAMRRHWFGDIQWLNYEGTFLRRSWETYPRNVTLPLRPDMDIRMRSLSLAWVLKSETFSMRSAYLFSERQLHSGGSPVIRAGLSRFSITGQGTLVDNSDLDWFPDLNTVNAVTNYALGIAPGYGYNFVRKDFFLSSIFVAGPAQNWIRYDLETGGSRYDIQLNLLSSLMISAGYNGPRFFGGISYRSQGFAVKLDETKLSANQNLFLMMAGYRFHEYGVFRHKLKDQSWWPFKGKRN